MTKLPFSEEQQLLRHKRLVSIVSAIIIMVLIFGLGWLIGRPLMDALGNKESFRIWIQAQGDLKYFIMIGLMIIQIVIAVIPGGPIEVAAGYAFGTWAGTAVCVLGAALGSAMVFWAARRYGIKLVRVFVPREEMESYRFMQDSKRLNALTFWLPDPGHAKGYPDLPGRYHTYQDVGFPYCDQHRPLSLNPVVRNGRAQSGQP